MIKRIISFVLICLFLVGTVSCNGKTSPSPATTGESTAPSQESKPAATQPVQTTTGGSLAAPKEEKTGPPPGELLRLGDLSVAISEINREESKAILHFAITKVSDKEPIPQPLSVMLRDDHNNEYKGQLSINTDMKAVLKIIPTGFVYVETVAITMPEVAPIVKVILGEKERNYKDIKFGVPQYLKDFGSATLTKGKEVQIGDWLTYTMDSIEPAIRQWELAVHIGNTDYNSLPVEAKMGSQLENGTISWSSSTISVPAKSKSLEKLPLAIPSWINDGPPYPRTLLILVRDKKTGEQVLKLYSMASGELPPLVGQGPKEVEDKFVAAYQKKGDLGNPLDLPRWLAGGSSPKDGSDLIMQEFPEVSQTGKSVIIWDKQSNASQAYVIPGKVWETYLALGGPASWLGYPIGKESISTKGHPVVDFEKGYIGTPDGVSFAAYEYASGTIAFTGRGSSSTIWVVNADGSGLKSLKSGAFPKWSPDGTRIAFASWALWHILVMNSDGSNSQEVVPRTGSVTYDAVDWSPDGRKLVFSNPNNMSFSIKEAIWVVNNDGTELKKLTNGTFPAWSPDGNLIAFQRDGFIHLITPNGTNEVKLVSGIKPSWSPDGQKIAFISDSGQKEISVVNKDGSDTTLILTHSAQIESVSYSPDGKWLVFAENKTGPQTYLFGPGNRLEKLQTDGSAYRPSWRLP